MLTYEAAYTGNIGNFFTDTDNSKNQTNKPIFDSLSDALVHP